MSSPLHSIIPLSHHPVIHHHIIPSSHHPMLYLTVNATQSPEGKVTASADTFAPWGTRSGLIFGAR